MVIVFMVLFFVCVFLQFDKNTLTDQALELLSLVPEGYIPLPHQIGGHRHVDGKLGERGEGGVEGGEGGRVGRKEGREGKREGGREGREGGRREGRERGREGGKKGREEVKTYIELVLNSLLFHLYSSSSSFFLFPFP